MMKKKSTIFALIGVLCVAVAMYFMYKETRDTYDIFIDDEPEPDNEPEPENEPDTIKKENNVIQKETATEPGTGTEPEN